MNNLPTEVIVRSYVRRARVLKEVKQKSEKLNRKITAADVGYAYLFLIIFLALISPALTKTKFLSPVPDFINSKTGQLNLIEADLLGTKYNTKAANYAIVPVDSLETKPVDRVAKLQSFLQKKHSPLAPYAQLIIDEADKNGIDWTLTTGIATIETSLGKNLSGKYNAWNIMAFENGRRIGARNYASWEEGIKAVSKLLGENYRYNMLKGIQVKYCPSYECSSQWVNVVTNTSEEILSYAVAN